MNKEVLTYIQTESGVRVALHEGLCGPVEKRLLSKFGKDFPELSGSVLKPHALNLWASIPKLEGLVEYKERQMLSKGCLHLITAHRKQCKTSVCIAFIKTLLEGSFGSLKATGDYSVIWFDCEQTEAELGERVKLAGLKKESYFAEGRLTIIPAKPYPPKERLRLLSSCIVTMQPDLVVLDGAASLVTDINSNDECNPAVEALKEISVTNNTAILSVLHLNPGNEKERGVMGTILGNECAEIYTTTRKNDRVTLKAKDLRYYNNEDFPEFIFGLGEFATPLALDEGNIIAERKKELHTLFSDIFHNGLIKTEKMTFSQMFAAYKSIQASANREAVSESTFRRNFVDPAKHLGVLSAERAGMRNTGEIFELNEL